MSSLSFQLGRIEKALRASFLERAGQIPDLEDAMAHALLKGGRRIRPLLALLVAENLPFPEAALPAALATEYFHAASLVADDLPSMDAAETRRDGLSTHRLYGEARALLVSYALISEGYRLIGVAGELYPQGEERGERVLQALSLTAQATGLQGATGGQYLDLYQTPTSLEEALDLLKRKTAALFGMAFGMGWIFGGGELKKLPLIQEAAHAFGLAFQLIDDLADEEIDRINGKSSNLSLFAGQKRAENLLDKAKREFGEALRALGLATAPFEELATLQLQV